MSYLYSGTTVGRIKFTDDTDCLAPDIRHYAGYPMEGHSPYDQAMRLVPMLEAAGLDVCVDTAEGFYESKDRSE